VGDPLINEEDTRGILYITLKDLIFFQDFFLREPLYSKDFMSTLGFERYSPSIEWCDNHLEYENLPYILIRRIHAT